MSAGVFPASFLEGENATGYSESNLYMCRIDFYFKSSHILKLWPRMLHVHLQNMLTFPEVIRPNVFSA